LGWLSTLTGNTVVARTLAPSLCTADSPLAEVVLGEETLGEEALGEEALRARP
jgi:hypothetical protein